MDRDDSPSLVQRPLVGAACRMLLSLIRMIQAFRDYRRNVNELSQLSDRELADIGLDRSDIPRVAAGSYSA